MWLSRRERGDRRTPGVPRPAEPFSACSACSANSARDYFLRKLVMTFAGVAFVIVAAAFAAVPVPARRAARVDPLACRAL